MADAAVTPKMAWQKRPASTAGIRTQHGMAYDSDRGVVVILGGWKGAGGADRLKDTWEYNGTTWNKKGDFPNVVSDMGMAYCPLIHKMVVFGGNNNSNYTYLYDGGITTCNGGADQWCLLCTPGVNCPVEYPGSRNYPVMAPGPGGIVIMFGGGGQNDTWLFNGAWTEICKNGACGTPPAGRHSHQMAFDSATNKVVLLGGFAGSALDDTWLLSYDAGTNTGSWSQVTTTVKPAARFHSSMGYDAFRGFMVMAFGDPPTDTTTWQGAPGSPYWTVGGPVGSAADSDSAALRYRSRHAMAYDGSRHVTVLYGGQGEDQGAGYLGDVWEYTSATPSSVPTLATGLGSLRDADNAPDQSIARTFRVTCAPGFGGVPDCTITGPPPGSGDPTPRGPLMHTNLSAYSPSEYGVNVAVGDIGHDNPAGPTIVTGAGGSYALGPHVKAWRWDNDAPISKISFFAYGTLHYGVKVGTGNIGCGILHQLYCSNGKEQILTGPGPGSVFAPQVRSWAYNTANGMDPNYNVNFYAYGNGTDVFYGVNVAGGNIDDDSWDEIVTGNGPGPGTTYYTPTAKVFNYDDSSVSLVQTLTPNLPPPCVAHGVHVATGNLDSNAYDDVIVGVGPDPIVNDSQLAAYLVTAGPTFTFKTSVQPWPTAQPRGAYAAGGYFGMSKDLAVGGEVGGQQNAFNGVVGGVFLNSSGDLQRINSFYFSPYNVWMGANVAAAKVPFQLPTSGAASGAGSDDVAGLVDVLLRFLQAIPDASYACDYCKEPEQGKWSEWGSDARKAVVMDQVAKLERGLGTMTKAERDLMLDDIGNLVSDKALGVQNAEALLGVQEQIQTLKALP